MGRGNKGLIMSNNKQIPTPLEFLHRDESGVYNEVDITQAMDEYAKLHVERIKQFLHAEICEHRDYPASRMCQEVLKFIDNQQSIIEYNKMEEEWEMDNYNEIKDEQQ